VAANKNNSIAIITQKGGSDNMPITITISAETSQQVRELALELADTFMVKNTQVTDSVTVSTLDEEPIVLVETKSKVAAEPVDEVAPVSEPVNQVMDVLTLRARVQAFTGSDSGRKARVKDLLNSYGSKSLSDIEENLRDAFIQDLEAV
jgi:hypothetical protein